MLQRMLCLLTLCTLAAAVGCGSSGPPKKATFKATGKLSVDDKPFGPATLTLSSTDKDMSSPSITGNVAADGTITYVTYGQEGIVTPGKYAVTMAGDIMTMKPVPPVEPATVEIKSGEATVDVKLKAIPGAAPVGGLPLPQSPPE
jgi:hypothetical protein